MCGMYCPWCFNVLGNYSRMVSVRLFITLLRSGASIKSALLLLNFCKFSPLRNRVGVEGYCVLEPAPFLF